jgi:hypothetical protein
VGAATTGPVRQAAQPGRSGPGHGLLRLRGPAGVGGHAGAGGRAPPDVQRAPSGPCPDRPGLLRPHPHFLWPRPTTWRRTATASGATPCWGWSDEVHGAVERGDAADKARRKSCRRGATQTFTAAAPSFLSRALQLISGVIRAARGNHDTAGHTMSEAALHLPALLLTSVWIRFGLSPALEFVTKLLSGGSCFMMDPGARGPAALDDAYFGVVQPGFPWNVAIVGAVLVGGTGAFLWVLRRRRLVPGWLPPAVGVLVTLVGLSPFVACRFESFGFRAEAVILPWLPLGAMLGGSFVLYWATLSLAHVVAGWRHEKEQAG